jgi:hypothetical protein
MKKRVINLKPLLPCDRGSKPLCRRSVGPRIGAGIVENRESLLVPQIYERFPSSPAHSIVAILTDLSQHSVRPYTLMSVLLISAILIERTMSLCAGCNASVFNSVRYVNNRSL